MRKTGSSDILGRDKSGKPQKNRRTKMNPTTSPERCPRTRIVHHPRTIRSTDFSFRKMMNLRELGLKRHIGFDDDIAAKLYSNMDSFKSRFSASPGKSRGGIFNLEFSLDGRLLVAACERDCVLIYDASNHKLLRTIEKAHHSCVNCVRFLDDKQFATCSDDNTIKMWDTRKLTSATKTLHGHSNWVKNIEFSQRDNIMVTSGFDGSIYCWDLKNPTENSMLHDKLFLTNGLMRTKLSADGTKMVVSTTSGYMMIVHDLNLATLCSDFKSFKPVVYRLMQMSGQSFPAGTIFNYLFMPTRKKNRLEFIDDFPIEAEVISSLQIHPHGWNAVSRSLNSAETQEVTSVHDIQKRDTFEYDDYHDLADAGGGDATDCDDIASGNSDSDEDSDDLAEETAQGGGGGGAADNNQRPTDLWMGYVSNFQYTSDRQTQPNMYENFHLPAMGIINSGLIGRSGYTDYFTHNPAEQNKVVVNQPRLTHHIDEKNVGRGYIKELCYSPDGRVVCSPYERGVRLLGFSDAYQELTYCVPDRPAKLVPLLEMNNYHPEIVVSCKFSPTDRVLVSGCLQGELVWYKPVL